MNIKNTDIINVKGQIKQTNKKQKLIKILNSNNTVLGSQTTDDSGNFNIEITPSGVFDISKVEICNKITELNEDSIEFNTITPLNSILTVPTPPTNVVYSDNFNITANLKNEYNEAIEGGLVKLLVGQIIVAEKETDENGNVTFTRKPVSTGNHTFTIEYEGDDYHNKATPQTINIVVGKETSILNIENPLPNSFWYSDKGILVEGVLIDNDDPNTPLNRKNISISCDGKDKTLTTDDNGRFSSYIKPTNAGTYSVTVEFEDENYSGNTTTIENIIVNDPYIDLSVTNPILSYADGDKATISATLHSSDPAGKTVSFTMGGNALGTGVTDGNGFVVCDSQYSSQGIGDIICEAEATVSGQVVSKTYSIHDWKYWNDGSSVGSLEVGSGVNCSSNGTYLSISTSTSGEKYVYLPVSVDKNDDWEWSFEIGALGTSQHFATQLIHNIANPSNGFVGFFENVGENIRMNGSDRTGQVISSRNVVVGDVLKWVYENGTLSLKLNNDTLYSSSVTFTDNPTFRYYTNSGRQQNIKNIVFKPL